MTRAVRAGGGVTASHGAGFGSGDTGGATVPGAVAVTEEGGDAGLEAGGRTIVLGARAFQGIAARMGATDDPTGVATDEGSGGAGDSSPRPTVGSGPGCGEEAAIRVAAPSPSATWRSRPIH
jgi:hypothetical protein